LQRVWQVTSQQGDFFEMALKLVIGNKNYSHVDAPWLALRASNIASTSVHPALYGEADKQRILSFTHSGKVPALIDGDVTIWDSLAIVEYAAERFPEIRLWPEDRASRRMRVRFQRRCIRALRRCATMRHESASAGRRDRAVGRGARRHRAHSANLDRVPRALRKMGPYLFGPFSGADAMFARWCIAFASTRSRRRPKFGLHGYDDVVTGFSGVDPRGPAETLVIEKFETV